jgi:uncharacterized protein
MKLLAASAALALTAFLGSALPASAARDGYVIDNAHLFSATAISAVNTKISALKAQTGKEIVIDTEPTLNGQTAPAFAEKVFSAQQVNGLLIFVAKPTIGVVPDTASQRWFTKSTTASIQSSVRGYFKSSDFDGGLNAGVDSAISIYQQHLSALNQPAQHRYVQQQPVTTHQDVGGGFGLMSWIFLLIGLFVVVMIVRAIFRAMSGPRVGYGPGPGGPGYGGPGYGGGYGPGYGGGGGGGFFSGLLGGLGGAFIGNELFGNRGGETIINQGGGVDQAGMAGGGQDTSGWQADPGQADMSNASFGDYTSGGDDSGGGGWGGGDSGGGDSGGGW